MPRGKRAVKRYVLKDERYGSSVVTSFINSMMRNGKKSIARKNFYGALDIVAKKSDKDPLEAFEKILGNVRPLVEVKSRRVGGANYQVPVEVNADRGQALAIRWLITYARKRGEKTFVNKLAGEFMDALNQTGSSYKKKEDTHRMAEANKAFSHFRW